MGKRKKTEQKVWWKSKLIWVNLIAFVASILQLKFGLVMNPELQGMILTFINIILRVITNEEIIWSKKGVNSE